MADPAHVLVLDDDEGILRLARKALERKGYRVTTAPSAAAAWESATAEAPDLLVLDYRLSGAETGLDFFRRLRRAGGAGAEAPAILVTGFSDESKIIEAAWRTWCPRRASMPIICRRPWPGRWSSSG
jgi:CheY-like chemotaxis protein